MTIPEIELETDVLVVGSGPMGAATALALATYGIKVHVVTRWNWLANSPRAHITNPRTVEVLRDLGVEADAAKYATPWEQMGEMVFAESLTGEELARANLVGRGDDRLSDYLTGSPCGFLDVPQLYLEPVLVTNAAARGASFAFNTEYLSHEQDESGVTAEVEDRLSGRRYCIRAKYLVGADGARSKILEQLGLPLQGQLGRASTAYVLFEADLSRYVAHRPGIIHFLVTPSASYGELGMGMLRCVRPWHTWIAGWGYDMDKEQPDFSDAGILEKVRGFVGDPDLEIKVSATSTWLVNEAYATQYSKGRVFLGGDAVHRHPPSSGLGSNTSIQDGFNLAWKLAYVLNGIAAPSLLDSYSAERAPVGEAVVKRANQSRRDYAALTEAFRNEKAQDPVAGALAKLRDTGSEGVAARDALRKAIDFKQDESNSQGVDQNQRYISQAVVVDPQVGEEVWRRDKEVYLQATTRPGAKIPHAWLVDKTGHRISTLDVTGKGLFSLVTGLSGQAWVQAAKQLNLPFLRTVVIGEPGSADPYTAWPRVSEIEEAGALLVRPDGYVAWRMSSAIWQSEEATALLTSALSSILGKPFGINSNVEARFSERAYAAT
ncbi:FAD-binding monooxygenase, PheA/TfdB family, similarity to 2,4-dichlorophenol 6-monooxygenase [plant metagenome]|uniref:FAD-binding monooxygenase, PheA/TfdB family, similarity to 2,4-dichlorophenol 6-monooxygenase n=1 Tax=plant metagenome TaxID=1297885 RepID=A0A484UPE5_9ZZZZ